MMASSRRSPGSGHSVGVMFAQVALSSFSLALCLLFSLSFANKLATILASRLLQLHSYFTLPCPISLNSLDLAGVRLLSPRGSQILPKQMQVPMIPAQLAQLS